MDQRKVVLGYGHGAEHQRDLALGYRGIWRIWSGLPGRWSYFVLYGIRGRNEWEEEEEKIFMRG